MGEKEDKQVREELGRAIEKAKLDPRLKANLLAFAEELANGKLEKLLESIKVKLNKSE